MLNKSLLVTLHCTFKKFKVTDEKYKQQKQIFYTISVKVSAAMPVALTAFIATDLSQVIGGG